MIKITLSGRVARVPSVSELTAKEFNDILIRGGACDLPSYLSMYCDISLKDLRSARLVSDTPLGALHLGVFDLDIKDTLTARREVIFHDGEYRDMGSLSIDTVMKAYVFELLRGACLARGGTEYELALYCLAVALLPPDSAGVSEAEALFAVLAARRWTEVMPHAFFLHRRSQKGSRIMLRLLTSFTPGLRLLQLRIRISAMRLSRQDRRVRYSNYVNYFKARWTKYLRLT